MSRLCFVIVGFGALVLGLGVSADEIDVDFTRQSYDRWLFRPEAGLDGGRWDTKGGGLHASVPKGPTSRGPIREGVGERKCRDGPGDDRGRRSGRREFLLTRK